MGRMIYTKIVIDMKTGKTLEREGRWYDGEIAECKGGGSSVNNVDYEYNDRMATIAEEQQAWAKDYYKMWETHFKPYETARRRPIFKICLLRTACTGASLRPPAICSRWKAACTSSN